MHYDKKHGAIHKSIEALDKTGMEIIETGDPDEFKKYLLETDNTICGRHPISVFLHVSKHYSEGGILDIWLTVKHLKTKSVWKLIYYVFIVFFCLYKLYYLINLWVVGQMSGNCSTKIKIKFLRYEQSSQCKSMRDSSVSYASAVAKLDRWVPRFLAHVFPNLIRTFFFLLFLVNKMTYPTLCDGSQY